MAFVIHVNNEVGSPRTHSHNFVPKCFIFASHFILHIAALKLWGQEEEYHAIYLELT